MARTLLIGSALGAAALAGLAVVVAVAMQPAQPDEPAVAPIVLVPSNIVEPTPAPSQAPTTLDPVEVTPAPPHDVYDDNGGDNSGHGGGEDDDNSGHGGGDDD